MKRRTKLFAVLRWSPYFGGVSRCREAKMRYHIAVTLGSALKRVAYVAAPAIAHRRAETRCFGEEQALILSGTLITYIVGSYIHRLINFMTQRASFLPSYRRLGSIESALTG